MVKITQMKKTTLRQAALRLAIVALVLLSPLGLRAQSSLFSEDFEDGSMPTGWTQDNVVGTASWSIATGDYSSSTGAGHGTYNAKITAIDRTTTTKLITPEINLSGVSSAVLSFMHIERDWYGDHDALRVYYRTSSSDSWTLLEGQEYTSAVASWTTEEDIVLPNLSSTYQLAFEFKSEYGYGVGLDNIVITKGASCVKPLGLAATLTPGNGAIATLSWTKGGTETNWVLEYSTASDFTGATQVTSGFTTTGNNISVDLTGLTAETPYYTRVKADCGGGDVSDWSAPISFKPTATYPLTIFGSETGTSSYIPMYGNYFDDYTKSECIIPATELETMAGATIKSMTFYASSVGTNNSTWANTNQKVFLKEVNSTTLGGSYSGMDDATIVFDGLLDMPTTSSDGYTISFSQDYTYEGGNLLIGIYNDDDGSYNNVTWYGKTGMSSGVSAYGNNSSSLSSVSYTAQTFLPRTTFTYLPNPTPKPRNLAYSSVSSSGATLTWEAPANVIPTGYEYQYKTSTAEWPTDWTSNGTNLTVTFNTLTASNNYTFRVRAIYDGVGESDPVETSFTTLDNCAFPTNLTASTTPGQGTKATFTWVKGYDETQWVLQYATNNAFTEGLVEVTDGFTVEGNNVTANLTGLTAETKYYARVKANCDGPTSSWAYFEAFTPTNYVDYTFNEDATSDSYYSYIPFRGSYVAYQTNSQFIIPQTSLGDLAGGTVKKLTFYSTSTYANVSWGDASFKVYVAEVDNTTFASNPTSLDWSAMEEVYSGSLSVVNSQMVIELDQAFTYSGTKNLMIGFEETAAGTNAEVAWIYKSVSNTCAYSYNSSSPTGALSYSRTSYLPKLTFNYLPTPYQKVAAINEGTITTTSAQLTWAAPETEATITGYAYQYKLSSAAEWPTTWSNLAANATSVTLQPLTAGSNYDFRIKVLYGEHESAVNSTSFFTECAIVTAFPWKEDFEAYATGDFNHPCWVNQHLSGDGSYLYSVVTESMGDNNTKKLKLNDQSAGTETMLRLPEMNLPGNDYQFVIDVYRNTSTYQENPYELEGIHVYVSTNGNLEGATELAYIPRHKDVSNSLIPAEEETGWYTYEIPVGISGNCYIILKGVNQWCTSIYMDNFGVEQIPTCARPTDLAKSEVTNHSATLTWTAGDPDQHNWQVAYSKTSFDPNTASFDINTVETRDFTTSTTCTYRMDRLFDAASTYYLYIRANCGTATEPDYSPWSRNGISLTTSAAAPAPSAFTASNIASTKVDLVWNAGGGDYEESWELYYVASTTAPETPTMTTEATKIVNVLPTTLAPYELTGLTAETKYYIWVRANHGTDGKSAWVALTNDFFTTLAACSAQDPVVSNITHNTATVNWDGESASGFTVKYRTSAVMGATVLSEAFSASSIPTGWTKYSGLVDEVINGTSTLSTTTSGWGTNTYALGQYNMKVNIYGSNCKYWLVTPEIELGTGNILNFDLALTDYGNSNVIEYPTQQPDDRFVVLIYADDAWTILREWNNSGSAYVYNNIATTGESVTIDLSSYNDKTVKIAFYGESTVSGASSGVDDNDLHIDNVEVGTPTDAGAWQDGPSTSATTANVAGLTPETKYDLKVVPDCDETQESTIVTFTTKSLFEKVIEANKWYAISSPVHNDGNNETLAGINNIDNAAYDLYGYDEGTGVWVKETASLTRGKGYIYRSAANTTLEFVGDYNTGNVSASNIIVSNPDADLKGFALVGNPYNHPIYKGVAFGSTYQYNTGWYSLQPNGCWYTRTNNDAIAAGEAALVKVSSSWDVALSFTDNANAPTTAKAAPATALAFTVNNGDYEDIAYAMLESGEGLPKIGHLNSEAPMLSIPVDDRRYAIADLGSSCESFDLNFRGYGEYTISLKDNGQMGYIHLIDRATGRDIDLLSQPTYTFTATGNDANRFMVKLTPDAAESAIGSFAYWNGNAWVVEGEGTLQLFDALGRRMMTKEVSSQITIPASQFPAAGVYILRLGEKSQKIVVK